MSHLSKSIALPGQVCGAGEGAEPVLQGSGFSVQDSGPTFTCTSSCPGCAPIRVHGQPAQGQHCTAPAQERGNEERQARAHTLR